MDNDVIVSGGRNIAAIYDSVFSPVLITNKRYIITDMNTAAERSFLSSYKNTSVYNIIEPDSRRKLSTLNDETGFVFLKLDTRRFDIIPSDFKKYFTARIVYHGGKTYYMLNFNDFFYYDTNRNYSEYIERLIDDYCRTKEIDIQNYFMIDGCSDGNDERIRKQAGHYSKNQVRAKKFEKHIMNYAQNTHASDFLNSSPREFYDLACKMKDSFGNFGAGAGIRVNFYICNEILYSRKLNLCDFYIMQTILFSYSVQNTHDRNIYYAFDVVEDNGGVKYGAFIIRFKVESSIVHKYEDMLNSVGGSPDIDNIEYNLAYYLAKKNGMRLECKIEGNIFSNICYITGEQLSGEMIRSAKLKEIYYNEYSKRKLEEIMEIEFGDINRLFL